MFLSWGSYSGSYARLRTGHDTSAWRFDQWDLGCKDRGLNDQIERLKVAWSNTMGDTTWELKDKMCKEYQNLFPSMQIFKDKNFIVMEYCNVMFFIMLLQVYCLGSTKYKWHLIWHSETCVNPSRQPWNRSMDTWSLAIGLLNWQVISNLLIFESLYLLASS